MAVCEEIEKRGRRGLAAALRVAVRAATAGSHRTSPREACQQGEFWPRIKERLRSYPALPVLKDCKQQRWGIIKSLYLTRGTTALDQDPRLDNQSQGPALKPTVTAEFHSLSCVVIYTFLLERRTVTERTAERHQRINSYEICIWIR